MQKVALPPIGLVCLAGLADAAGGHSFSFYLLVLAVPAAAVAALASLDSAIRSEHRRRLHHAWLQAIALVLILAGAAVRAPVRSDPTLPRFAVSALIACLVVYALEGLVLAAPTLKALGRGLKPKTLAR
jgi:hypothetical protein